MTLPASGQISLNDVHIELGGTAGTQISLQAASTGSVAELNTNNTPANKPDEVAPHSLTEFYSYNHAATYSGPTIQTAVVTEEVAIGCGVPWELRITWTTDFSDDATYELHVYQYGGSVVQTGLTTGDSSWVHNTTITGDALLSTNNYSGRYTLKIVRIADSVVMFTIDSNEVTTQAGDAC